MTDAPARAAPAPEFSRPALVERLYPGAAFEGAARPDELAALAARFRLPAVRALAFRAEVQPWGPGGWRVTGRVEAELTQTCVVTLEPVETRIAEPFVRYFAPKRRLEEAAELLDPDGEDEPEPLTEALDIGDMASEAAALAIDPYPRRPDAAFPGAITAPPGVEPLTDEEARPFARLAALRGGEGG